MFPGLNEADCRVAEFRYRQMVSEGQRQQAAAGLRPAGGANDSPRISMLERVGVFLVSAGQHLQQACTSQPKPMSLGSADERAVVA